MFDTAFQAEHGKAPELTDKEIKAESIKTRREFTSLHKRRKFFGGVGIIGGIKPALCELFSDGVSLLFGKGE